MHQAPAVGFALVLALSGCSGLLGGATPDARDPTITPAPVPAPNQGAPGVSVDQTAVEPSVLLDAHGDALLDRPYRIEFRFRATPLTTDANATVVNQTAVLGADRERFYQSTRLAGPLFGVEGVRREVYWSNGTSGGAGRFSNGQLVDRADVAFDRPPVTGQFEAYLGTVFRTVPVRTVDRIERNGSAGYRIVATAESLPDAELTAPFRNATDVRAIVVVTPSGQVETVRVTYVGYERGESYRVRRTVRVRSGAVSVPAPDWHSGTDTPSTTGTERAKDVGTTMAMPVKH